MEEWWREQLARGLPDFAGTTITGSIPIREELLNRLIASYLAGAGMSAGAGPRFEVAHITRFIRSATVHAEPGVVTLRLEIRV